MTVDFDDRVLAHLQVVISAKLRRGESFMFTWKDDPSVGNGRTSIWLAPTLPLGFKYFGSRTPSLNPAWVEALMLAANSSGGLRVVPEPGSDVPREDLSSPDGARRVLARVPV